MTIGRKEGGKHVWIAIAFVVRKNVHDTCWKIRKTEPACRISRCVCNMVHHVFFKNRINSCACNWLTVPVQKYTLDRTGRSRLTLCTASHETRNRKNHQQKNNRQRAFGQRHLHLLVENRPRGVLPRVSTY